MKRTQYGYMVLSVVTLLLLGLIYAWSVFRGPLQAEFNWTDRQTSMTFSISMMMFCLGGLFGGILTGKKGPRVTFLLSAIFLFAGFALVSRAQDLTMVYLAYGGLCGTGVGFAYNAILSTVMTWFKGKEGMASGFLLMGFGFGGLVLGTLSAKLMQTIGWRPTFLLLGMVMGGWMLLVAMILKRKPVASVPCAKGESEICDKEESMPCVKNEEALRGAEKGEALQGAETERATAQKMGDNKKAKEITMAQDSSVSTGQMCKTPTFWLYFLWAVITTACGLAVINTAAPFAMAITGKDATYAAAVAGIVSLANGGGRVLIGFFYDKFRYWPTLLLADGMFLAAGAALLLCWKTGSVPLLFVAFVLIGLSYGFVPPTNSSIINDFYGPKNYGINLAMVNLNILIASYLGPLCGGGDYGQTFLFVIGFSLAATVLSVAIHVVKGRKR